MSILGLGLKLGSAIDEGFSLNRILVFEVKSGDFQVGFQFVINGVLFLAGLKRNSGQDLGSLAPVLLSLINVGQMLAN